MTKKWTEWRITRAALYGAIVGVLNSLYRIYAVEAPYPYETFEVVSRALGGAIGGAFLFALVAWARNFFTRPKER